jgi:hypothetical protein
MHCLHSNQYTLFHLGTVVIWLFLGHFYVPVVFAQYDNMVAKATQPKRGMHSLIPAHARFFASSQLCDFWELAWRFAPESAENQEVPKTRIWNFVQFPLPDSSSCIIQVAETGDASEKSHPSIPHRNTGKYDIVAQSME